MKRSIIIAIFLFASNLVFPQQETADKQTISIGDPWIRPSAKGSNTALFFEVSNKGEKPDTLLSAKFEFAEIVEVHETYKKSEDVMGMRPVKYVVIPPKSSVKFKPRDLHIMLISLNKDLRQGEKYDAVLFFKNAGEIKINAIVRDMPMGGMRH
jgi:copper(I)-binding protein